MRKPGLSSGGARYRVSRAVYRRLLWLFPRSFRQEFGDDMTQLFGDRLRDARPVGPAGAGRIWARALGDVIKQAPREWWRRIRPSKGSDERFGPSRREGRPDWAALGDTVWQDIRYAFRTFARNPVFTATAVLTVALGIGANTAVFTIMNGVVFKPLRLGSPQRLMAVWEHHPVESESGESSSDIFQDWREQNQSFEDLTAWTWDQFVISEEGESIPVDGVFTHPNFFAVLEIDPLFGRPFTSDDAESRRRGEVVIISHRLWADRWGADPSVIGRRITVDGTPVSIVGVMPPALGAPDVDVDIWVPAGLDRGSSRWTRHNRRYNIWGRLRENVTPAQAERDLSRVVQSLARSGFDDIYHGWSAKVVPLRERVLGGTQAVLWIAFASVGLVLLIACANIASMLLARATVRGGEMALRAALGAGRNRIVRQLMTESLVLAVLGGVAGVLVARYLYALVMFFEPGIIPRAEELSLDWEALVFAGAISLVAGVIFGLVPALQSAKLNLLETLKEGGARATGARRHGRTRSVLVSGQLALTVVLLSGSLLLLRTMFELRRVDPGFDAGETLAARIFLDARRYDSPEKKAQYYQQLIESVSTLPAVTHVGASSALPMDPLGINYDLPYRLPGQEHLETAELPAADFRVVTPGYFKAMGMELRAGRTFDRFDRPGVPFVAVVSETMARQVWPGQDPVGQRFNTPSTDWHWFEIIGVVGDTRYYGLNAEPQPEMYVALAQVPRNNMTVVAKTEGEPSELVATLSNTVLGLDPAQPAHSVIAVETLVAENVAAEQFYTVVLGAFAGLALILSAAGIYGVLSYWVSQRTHEIGLRMTLGATRSRLVGLVVGQAMWLVGGGIVVGIAGALAATQVLSGVLYQVESTDPATYLAVTLALLGVALLACWVPAMRASRVEPMEAIRR